MADSRITDLTELTSVADEDVFYIVDASDTTDNAAGSSKKLLLKTIRPVVINDTDTYACDAGVSVNDFVYLDGTSTLQLSTNTAGSTLPVYGVVREKPTSTTAKLTRLGERGGFSGLTPNTVYYLSTAGGYTSTPPTAAGTYIVPIGIGKNSSTMVIKILDRLIINS